MDALEREQAHQSRALDIVDSRLSGVIMENYKAFGACEPASTVDGEPMPGRALTPR